MENVINLLENVNALDNSLDKVVKNKNVPIIVIVQLTKLMEAVIFQPVNVNALED